MLVATVKRRMADEMLGLRDVYEWVEFDAPELEAMLRRGGSGEMGCDFSMVVCVVPKEAPDGQ